jgi:hypothetical protein
VNYKRKKARKCSVRQGMSRTSWRAKYGLPVDKNRDGRHCYDKWHPYLSMMNSYPRWWDILFHVKPWRAKCKQLVRKIERGADWDNIAFPLNNKPHVCYW